MSIYLARIGIQDFRTFGVFDVQVPAAPSLVLLTGPNGLGKSNFFDAIEWGLTGTIRRFAPYLQKGRKKLAESDYLTRRGAEPGSHKVTLTFSDGEPVERSANKTMPMASIITKLARSDRPAIEDLSTYLALTHFLGQAAQQRFTSKEPHDQWQALKGPSGLERLEHIRAGLRGRPIVAAFSRRLEKERADLATLKRQIADWQGWAARRDRLQQAARATGVLTPSEVQGRADALEAEFGELLGEAATVISGESISGRLADLGDRIGDALRDRTTRLAALGALDDLPTLYTTANTETRVDHPVLVRLRQEASEALAAVERARPGIEAAYKAVTDKTATIAAIEREIGLLEAARIDIVRRGQLASQIEIADKDVAEIAAAIASKRATVEQIDTVINQHGDAAAHVARRRSEVETAHARLESLSTLKDLEAEAAKLAAAVATAREVAFAARRNLDPLKADLTRFDVNIAEAVQARAEAARHATAISDALAQLASHIHHDDTLCPVCRTTFEPGALKSLAETSAAATDERLARIDEELERLRERQVVFTTQIASLQSVVDAPAQLERNASAAVNAVTDARAALALALGVDAKDDLAAVARAHDRSAVAALAEAQGALGSLAGLAAQATQLRETVSPEFEDLILREGQVRDRLATHHAENIACADRIAARGLADTTVERVDQRLTGRRDNLEGARAQLSRLTDTASATRAAIDRLRSGLAAAERELAAAESARAAAETTTRELVARWTRTGLSGEPSQAALDEAKGALADFLNVLRALAERQLALAKDNEGAVLHAEVAQVQAAMRQAGGESGVADPGAYIAGLQGKATAASDAIKLTLAARAAVRGYSEELKTEADDYSSRVLAPLNVVIDDFNEAMLSTPGETIQFKADTRVDATSFGMALRYRDQLENAIETQKELPPQVMLSEGQLAANGFSILCAASTAYPWSTWRALLLDDPLQHNDIIHTAAFVDVMRNMVELNGYQLIMSSHDRGESDFISRKFDAAGLPCTTILLTAPSDKGVVWDPPLRNNAADRLMRGSADGRRSDSA